MRRLLRFFRVGLWEIDLRDRSWPFRAALSVLRVIGHVWVHYDRHHVGIRAAGLSLFSLLSIVPVLAIAFGVAEGLDYRSELEAAMDRSTEDLPEYLTVALDQIRDLVSRTSFRALGLVGSLVLAYTALTMFVRVEQALNFAWRTSQSRGWLTRLTSFVSVVVFVPLLLLGALVTTSTLGSPGVAEWLADHGLGWATGLYDAGLWTVPYLMAMAAFMALYKLMPSVKVRWRPALISGAVTGVALVGMHTVYVALQLGVANANAIYATLAALPLFLLYLQAAWTVVLLGAEVGYAVQNLHRIGPGRDLETLAPATRELVGLRLAQEVAAHYAAGSGALSLGELAARLDVPVEWLDQALEDLVRAEVLLSVRGGRAAPARALADLPMDAVARGVRGAIPPRLESRLELDAELGRIVDDARTAARAELGKHALVAAAKAED